MLPFVGTTGQNRYIHFLYINVHLLLIIWKTFHTPNRQFWDGKVFKTSEFLIYLLKKFLHAYFYPDHFADHPLEDIIEKIACQFTARHIRGCPRPPFWYPGWSLCICDSRYNDRDRVFIRIKNWNSCVPEKGRVKNLCQSTYSSGPFSLNDSGVRLSGKEHWKVQVGLGITW